MNGKLCMKKTEWKGREGGFAHGRGKEGDGRKWAGLPAKQTNLKFCMKCRNLSTLLARGTITLISVLAMLSFSFFTFMMGPKGRNRTRRWNSWLWSPLKVSSYKVPLSLSVRYIPAKQNDQRRSQKVSSGSSVLFYNQDLPQMSSKLILDFHIPWLENQNYN